MTTITPYIRSSYPTIEGNDRVYFDNEFRKLQDCIRAIISALDSPGEGTWTPTLTGSVTNPTVTYSFNSGLYTKVGKLVYVYCGLQINTISGGSGNALVNGLPFTVYDDGGAGQYPMWPLFMRGPTWGATPGTSPIAWADSGDTIVELSASKNNASEDKIRVSDLSASDEIYFTGCYRAV